MHSVPPETWNQIAEEQKLRSPWAKEVFLLAGDQFDQRCDQEYSDLLKRGVSQEVAHAYLMVKPLLLENRAISRHIQKMDDLSLRAALPEVTTVQEAVMLASLETRLTVSQQKQLSALLSKDLSTLRE